MRKRISLILFLITLCNLCKSHNIKNDTILIPNGKYQLSLMISPFYMNIKYLNNVWNIGIDAKLVGNNNFNYRMSYFHSSYYFNNLTSSIEDYFYSNYFNVGIEKRGKNKQRKFQYYYGGCSGYIHTKDQSYFGSIYSKSRENFISIGIFNGIDYRLKPNLKIGMEFSLDFIYGNQIEKTFLVSNNEFQYETKNTLTELYSTKPLLFYLSFIF